MTPCDIFYSVFEQPTLTSSLYHFFGVPRLSQQLMSDTFSLDPASSDSFFSVARLLTLIYKIILLGKMRGKDFKTWIMLTLRTHVYFIQLQLISKKSFQLYSSLSFFTTNNWHRRTHGVGILGGTLQNFPELLVWYDSAQNSRRNASQDFNWHVPSYQME